MIGWLITNVLLIVVLIALITTLSVLFIKREKEEKLILLEKENLIKELQEKKKQKQLEELKKEKWIFDEKINCIYHTHQCITCTSSTCPLYEIKR